MQKMMTFVLNLILGLDYFIIIITKLITIINDDHDNNNVILKFLQDVILSLGT